MALEFKTRLDQCLERDGQGRPQLTVTLPDEAAIEKLDRELPKHRSGAQASRVASEEGERCAEELSARFRHARAARQLLRLLLPYFVGSQNSVCFVRIVR